MDDDIYNKQCIFRSDWIDIYIEGEVRKAFQKCGDGCWDGNTKHSQ